VDPDFKINLMPQAEQDLLNKRRSNCVLNTDKREALGIHMPPIGESVRRALKSYKTAKLAGPKAPVGEPASEKRTIGPGGC
jgi:hypothetical protein